MYHGAAALHALVYNNNRTIKLITFWKLLVYTKLCKKFCSTLLSLRVELLSCCFGACRHYGLCVCEWWDGGFIIKLADSCREGRPGIAKRLQNFHHFNSNVLLIPTFMECKFFIFGSDHDQPIFTIFIKKKKKDLNLSSQNHKYCIEEFDCEVCSFALR